MHFYGLIIGIAILIGINYFQKHNTVIPKNKEAFFIVGILTSAIIGARTYHVIDQWSFYSQNLWLIPQTWNGGLGIFGALIGGLIFSILYINPKTYLVFLDSITPILPLCQAIGRLGNFVNQENPVWWLEALLDLTLFYLIFRYPKNPTAKYFIGYGLIRFVTEFWRHDTWIINNLKIGQLISIFFIFVGVLFIYHARSKISQNHH